MTGIEWGIVGFILGVVCTLGAVLTARAELGAERWGQALRDTREPYDWQSETETDIPLVRVRKVPRG